MGAQDTLGPSPGYQSLTSFLLRFEARSRRSFARFLFLLIVVTELTDFGLTYKT